MEISREFEPLLRAHNLHALDEQSATTIGTWPDLTLAFMNKGWSKFAKENGGQIDRWCLGASILDVIPPVLLPFYREHFEAVLSDDRPWEHVYECSSPDVFRLFHMLVFPLSGGRGLLMIHSLRRESSHVQPRGEPADEYVFTDGFFHQCVHCRRTRRIDDIKVWDWIPELVRAPRANTSHGLCQHCFAFYYNEGGRNILPPISTIELDDKSQRD
jgi:hypothetical protein